ncbi:hypothetical protein JW960_06245 [candidate division KSB1 bacterium]|nr:hypothetical protein [candidate division KSB1 bacterium]
MKLNNNLALFLVPLLLFFSFCEKNASDINTSSDMNSKNDDVLKISELKLINPESIPSIVNEKALEIARKNRYTTIRILQVADSKTPTFNIYYPETDQYEMKSYNIELDLECKTALTLKDVTQLHMQLLNTLAIAKPTYETCWDLATIFPYANYSGTPFRFSLYKSYYGYPYGWWHKIIYSLLWNNGDWNMCNVPLTDDRYNDLVNSFQWSDDGPDDNGRIARPVSISLFEHEDRQGDEESWTIPHTPIYSTLYPVRSINSSSVGNVTNKVTSIDMFVRVFTPTN